MIDYGIMALVLIQLGAVIGCLLAWFRIRTEIDRIKDRAVTEPALHTALENRITPALVRLAEVEAGLTSCEAIAGRAVVESTRAVKAMSQTDDFERKLVSIQNSLSALKRHRTPKADPDGEPEEVSIIETIDKNSHIPEFDPPPSHNGRNMSTFGKSA